MDITAEPKPKSKKKAIKTPDALRIKFLEDMLETNRTEAEGWRQIASDQKDKIAELKAQVANLQESLQGFAASIEAIRL